MKLFFFWDNIMPISLKSFFSLPVHIITIGDFLFDDHVHGVLILVIYHRRGRLLTWEKSNIVVFYSNIYSAAEQPLLSCGLSNLNWDFCVIKSNIWGNFRLLLNGIFFLTKLSQIFIKFIVDKKEKLKKK